MTHKSIDDAFLSGYRGGAYEQNHLRQQIVAVIHPDVPLHYDTRVDEFLTLHRKDDGKPYRWQFDRTEFERWNALPVAVPMRPPRIPLVVAGGLAWAAGTGGVLSLVGVPQPSMMVLAGSVCAVGAGLFTAYLGAPHAVPDGPPHFKELSFQEALPDMFVLHQEEYEAPLRTVPGDGKELAITIGRDRYTLTARPPNRLFLSSVDGSLERAIKDRRTDVHMLVRSVPPVHRGTVAYLARTLVHG